ncbi:hypothetical protein DEU56DRAFT_756713 [Suillus clintonianus]|uniref:uncharacterized protein n=1 Tax=Suillus clintonianus TaxID=1904413 RepID=UPI001B87E3AF|nr:uncharacterized protein DEU56DRAFT_756713 [Suillus clintonianus]KAG2135334.1 hypothetical protein DEU56DRAFT_756713 [Suillus clintonianus]
MDPKPSVNPSRTITHDQVLDMGADAECTETHQVPSPTHGATNLPVEILRVIMELTMPPPLQSLHFLDSTIISRYNRHSRSCSLQTLRKHLLVCKYWYDVGISFLYRRVVILQSKQLFRLAHVVSNNRSLGEMILSLHLECYVGVSQMATASTAVDSILAVAPNLAKVAIAPILKGQPSFSLVFLRLFALAQNTHSRTTDLDLRINRMLKYTLNLMSAFTYLTTFHIDMILEPNDELPTEHLHFPFLEELQITWHCWHPSENDVKVFTALAETLSLPSLQRLLLTSQALEDRMFIEPLLRKFGHGLHFVSLTRPYIHNRYRVYDFRRPIPLAPLLSMCPNLRHLAMDTSIPIQVPAHAYLTWVDLWAPRRNLDPGEQPAVTLLPHEEKIKLPSLRGVRLLDLSLFSFSGARTPLLIPPDMVRSTESIVWSYSSLDLRHDPGLLYQQKTDEFDDMLAQSWLGLRDFYATLEIL